MSDVFDEVADDLRRLKLQQFWKENGSWIIGGAIGAVILTGVLTLWRQWSYQRDMAATTELTRLVTAADLAKLESYAVTADKNHAMMARFIAADAHLQRGEKDKALALYNEVGGTIGLDSTWRDLARIHSISLRLDKDDPATLAKELAALSGDKGVWRFTAREMEASLAAKQGEMQSNSIININDK